MQLRHLGSRLLGTAALRLTLAAAAAAMLAVGWPVDCSVDSPAASPVDLCPPLRVPRRARTQAHWHLGRPRPGRARRRSCGRLPVPVPHAVAVAALLASGDLCLSLCWRWAGFCRCKRMRQLRAIRGRASSAVWPPADTRRSRLLPLPFPQRGLLAELKLCSCSMGARAWLLCRGCAQCLLSPWQGCAGSRRPQPMNQQEQVLAPRVLRVLLPVHLSASHLSAPQRSHVCPRPATATLMARQQLAGAQRRGRRRTLGAAV